MENNSDMTEDFKDHLELKIKKQIEYYFSTDNLIKDIYLRKNMDKGGWVLLTTIASFRRISALTNDLKKIMEALKYSDIIDISADGLYIRPKCNPTEWIINEYNTMINDKEFVSEKGSLNLNRPRTTSDLVTVLEGEGPSIANNIGQMRKLSIHFQRDLIPIIISEEDFHDHEIQSLFVVTPDFSRFCLGDLNKWSANSTTMNYIKKRNLRSISLCESSNNWYPPIRESNVKTYVSHGRNNNYSRSKSISNNIEIKRKILPLKTDRDYNQEYETKDCRNIKWSYENSCSNDDIDNTKQNQIGFTFHRDDGEKDIKYNAEQCRAGFTYQDYTSFKINCLHDRNFKGREPSQKMNMLYRFWSFFLREHFNRNLFIEFRKYSLEDFQMNKRYGIECLFRFYSYGLEKKFRKDIFNQFQIDTLEEYNKGYKYGLEKFWAFLHYSQRKVDINNDLKNILNAYMTLQDFRIDFTPPEGFFANRSQNTK